jgi:hypothetical protein
VPLFLFIPCGSAAGRCGTRNDGNKSRDRPHCPQNLVLLIWRNRTRANTGDHTLQNVFHAEIKGIIFFICGQHNNDRVFGGYSMPSIHSLSLRAFSLITFLIINHTAQAQEVVSFESLDSGLISKSTTLRGYLFKPDGPGPFPAVVGLHGCVCTA